ncbi:MAG: hypothetical protein KAI24_21630, partial [Planctomycetes bacterium]|nr:hypothetical protein [Planctomycetota bacterium]
ASALRPSLRVNLMNLPSLRRGLRAASLFLLSSLPVSLASAQDNVLIYGNSIVFAPTVAFFSDLVVQAGLPEPHIVQSIGPDQKTSHYVNQSGLITTGVPAGETWRAMIVQGGTIENNQNIGNPSAFQSNMMTLANALFAHSPNALFVGHETGADHPNSTSYPGAAPDPATWLQWSHDGYAAAAAAITAAHPSSPPAVVAEQGTAFASTAGYPSWLYLSDHHHLSNQGRLLSAMLWYIEIYGGRVEDIEVDFSVSTPLVAQLQASSISEEKYYRLVGLADRSQPAADRPFPGSDADFQLRTIVNGTHSNLLTYKVATAGDTLRVKMASPLGASQSAPAAVYAQFVPPGQLPNGGLPPQLWLDASQMHALVEVTDLNGGPTDLIVPSGFAGYTMWLQAASRDAATNAIIYSDAQQVRLR